MEIRNKGDMNQAKIFLLALADRIPGLPVADLQSYAQDTLFFDYFTVAEAYAELSSHQLLLAAEAKNETKRDALGQIIQRVHLTPAGRGVLDNLLPHLLPALHHQLELFNRNEQHKEAVNAHYSFDGDKSYTVVLTARDKGKELLQIKLSVPDEGRAREFCSRWSEVLPEIYQDLLNKLSEKNE